jgi:hypothetical protein
LAIYWNLPLKSGSLETKILRNLAAIFPMENPLYRSKSHFSGQNMAKFGPKKTLVSTNVGPLLEIGTYPPLVVRGVRIHEHDSQKSKTWLW